MRILPIPPAEDTEPAPGKRVRQTLCAYSGTDVYHTLYLPTDWQPDKTYPVLVEYTGNWAPHFASTGEVKDANMGYGLSRGKGFLWITLPYIAENKTENQLLWWGDERATVDYAKKAVPFLCGTYGGDMNRICLCGFSRGAIAVNYIGLYDDEIASLWKAFIANEHYDGVREWEGTSWGSPLEAYRASATKRLERLDGRPVLIIHNDFPEMTQAIRDYIGNMARAGQFTFMDVPVASLCGGVPNVFFPQSHTDKWLLFDNEYTAFARKWLRDTVIDAE